MRTKAVIASCGMVVAMTLSCHVVGILTAIKTCEQKVKQDLQVADMRGQQYEVVDGIFEVTVRGSVETVGGDVVHAEESRRIFLWWHWPV